MAVRKQIMVRTHWHVQQQDRVYASVNENLYCKSLVHDLHIIVFITNSACENRAWVYSPSFACIPYAGVCGACIRYLQHVHAHAWCCECSHIILSLVLIKGISLKAIITHT
jgi:hypothetical protein